MGEFPHTDKGNFPVACNFQMGYFPHMKNQEKDGLDDFVRGLRIIKNVENFKMKPLSEAAGMSESGIKDLFRYNSSPKVVNAHAIAKTLGRTVDEVIRIGATGQIVPTERPAEIAVAGKVGAGASVELVDAYAKGDGLYRVACPPQLAPRGIVAVEVEGDSMAPIYSPGTVLFYSRDALGVPTEAIGRICVCEDTSGKAWVKVIRTGSQEGTFSLISLNPETEHMHGVNLKWAAPVRFDLPPEYVERIG